MDGVSGPCAHDYSHRAELGEENNTGGLPRVENFTISDYHLNKDRVRLGNVSDLLYALVLETWQSKLEKNERSYINQIETDIGMCMYLVYVGP